MLVELSIRDLALIESAEVELASGLNALTGETGAGKSLLVAALELLRGATPRGGAASWVRSGAAQARVEGRFQLDQPELRERVRAALGAEAPELAGDLGANGEGESAELILGRTLGRDGRTRAHVNQRPVPLRVLARIAALVLEIHGQNDHQQLFEPAEQGRLFDACAGLAPGVAEYARLRAAWLERREELAALETRAAARAERLELLCFQRAELRAARLSAEEPGQLGEERELLRSAGELRRELGGIVQSLFEQDGAARGRVQLALRVLERWAERLPRLAGALEALRAAEIQLGEAGGTLGSFLDGVADDPARLEALEERLAELERLAQRYRSEASRLPEVLESVERELAELEGGEASRTQLAARLEAARAELEHAAASLARRRRAAAPRLVRAIRTRLEQLGLSGARFEIALRPRLADDEQRFGPAGTEELEFELATNPGEPLQPLRRVASFGEAARIMLALRSELSSGDCGRTLVFDEIDSGIGGRLGPEVGRALRDLSGRHQVLCVTHLPPIAALAGRHLSIAKEVAAGRTRTVIAVLEGDARVSEVADMIAGGADEATARAEARRLLRTAARP
jgi:DNA repair protein RecN (Recombination protein N)